MLQKLDAVVENGTLKLATPLRGLSEGQRVRLIVAPMIEPADFKGLSENEREDLFAKWMEQNSVFENVPEEPPGPPVVLDYEPFPLPPGGPLLSEMILEDRR